MNVLVEAGRLAAEGTPFALATVVGVERPSSARVGDRALVTADGELHGWVGGACTEPEVVRLSLAALADGGARRERIESRCASEGAVEVLIEPQRAPLVLAVVGDAPAARTLRELAGVLGWRVTSEIRGAEAVVVATMGREDEAVLEAALAGDAGYIGLVASAKRAASLGLDEESRARVRSPAGLDLGPSSQEEIAVAILAELVQLRASGALAGARAEIRAPAVVTAQDPVCGMAVTAGSSRPVRYEGTDYYFCCAGCRQAFEQDPDAYVTRETHADKERI